MAQSSAAGKKDYSSLAREVNEVEGQIGTLLDELVGALDRGSRAGPLDAQVAQLADEAGFIAQSLQASDTLDAAGKAAALDSLGAQAEALILKMPDAIVAGEHSRWAGKIEEAHSHLSAIKSGLNAVCMPHLSAAERQRHEQKMARSMKLVREKLARAHDGIIKRSHVPGHPLHSNLLRIRDAIVSTRKHLIKTVSVRRERLHSGALHAVREQMRQFLTRELEGRMYVDSTTIQMRSALTGKVVEWPNEGVNSEALHDLLSSGELSGLLVRAKERHSVLSAKFECRAGASGMFAELTAGERVIDEQGIKCTPHIARIAL